jgi:hypothetical protein
MTYRTASGRQIIVAATGGGEDAALVAFALATTASNVGYGGSAEASREGGTGRPYADDRRIDSSRGGK